MSEAIQRDGAMGIVEMLLKAADSWRNGKALGVLAASMLIAVMLFAWASTSAMRGGFVLAMFAVPVSAALIFIGQSAAGLLYMDQAAGRTSRSVMDAVVGGVGCAGRMLVLGVVGALTAMLGLLCVHLVLFLCKIPVLGDLLYLVAFPVMAIGVAVFYLSSYILFALAGPALWTGATLREATSILLAIVRRRPAKAIFSVLLLTVMVGMVGAIVFSAAGVGVFTVHSNATVASAFGGRAMGGASPFMMGNFAGLTFGGIFGAMSVFALAATVVLGTLLLGSAYVFLDVTKGLDVRRVETARDIEGDMPRQAGPMVLEKLKPSASACSRCGEAVESEDVFCGSCGLRQA